MAVDVFSQRSGGPVCIPRCGSASTSDLFSPCGPLIILAGSVGVEPTGLLITSLHLSRVLHYRPAHFPFQSALVARRLQSATTVQLR